MEQHCMSIREHKGSVSEPPRNAPPSTTLFQCLLILGVYGPYFPLTASVFSHGHVEFVVMVGCSVLVTRLLSSPPLTSSHSSAVLGGQAYINAFHLGRSEGLGGRKG